MDLSGMLGGTTATAGPAGIAGAPASSASSHMPGTRLETSRAFLRIRRLLEGTPSSVPTSEKSASSSSLEPWGSGIVSSRLVAWVTMVVSRLVSIRSSWGSRMGEVLARVGYVGGLAVQAVVRRGASAGAAGGG